MNIKIAFKIVTLLVALSLTLLAIRWLNQGHMNAFWTSLGVDRGGVRLNWCYERASSIYLYKKKAKLLEKQGKWHWSGAEERELDYLRVEKWFAKYCQIPVDQYIQTTEDSESPLFEAVFIDGQRLTLYQTPSGAFRIQNKVFISKKLHQAMQELLAFGEKVE